MRARKSDLRGIAENPLAVVVELVVIVLLEGIHGGGRKFCCNCVKIEATPRNPDPNGLRMCRAARKYKKATIYMLRDYRHGGVRMFC